MKDGGCARPRLWMHTSVMCALQGAVEHNQDCCVGTRRLRCSVAFTATCLQLLHIITHSPLVRRWSCHMACVWVSCEQDSVLHIPTQGCLQHSIHHRHAFGTSARARMAMVEPTSPAVWAAAQAAAAQGTCQMDQLPHRHCEQTRQHHPSRVHDCGQWQQ